MKSDLFYERCLHEGTPSSLSREDIQRIDELRKKDEEFLERHPSKIFLAGVERKHHRRIAAWAGTMGVALAACLAAVLIIPSTFRDRNMTRMKGSGLDIFAYHKVDSGVELLPLDAVLHDGDEIQLAYYSREPVYAVIFSIDGRGGLTRHMPLHNDEALSINTPKFVLLPYSYRLDDAPLYEDVYFIVSPYPFKIKEIEPFFSADVIDGSTVLSLPKPFRYTVLHIKKAEE